MNTNVATETRPGLGTMQVTGAELQQDLDQAAMWTATPPEPGNDIGPWTLTARCCRTIVCKMTCSAQGGNCVRRVLTVALARLVGFCTQA